MRRCLACDAAIPDGWRCPQCGSSPTHIGGFLSFAPQLARSGGFENPTEFAVLAEAEAGNFWFRARNRLIVWAIRRYFAPPRTVLEIGCGTGYVLSGIHDAFPEASLSGSEASCVGLEFASRRVPGASLFQMDARHIPFRDEFDVVGAFDVLEHVQEDDQVLRQMWAATRPGGGIVVTVPQHPFLWSAVDEFAGHVRRYRAGDLIGKVAGAGFRVVRTTSFVSLLLPLMMQSRLWRKNTAGGRKAKEELSLNPVINTALECGLGLERSLIRLGLSFPAGGSLLVVAVKA